MSTTPLQWRLVLAASALLVAAAGVAVALWKPRNAPLEVPVAVAYDADIEAWCADTLVPIAGGGCLAVPPPSTTPVPLLVYLHGRYAPKTIVDELERQKRVARLGVTHGFAVLAMRGVQGECKQAELADAWCWPSNPRVEADGPTFVAKFEPAIAEARTRVGAGPNVLLGFSNGAYFATLIATRSLQGFDAIAIAHGGPVPPTHAAGKTPPLLLITADDDPSDGEMRQLDAELAREKWPHELVSREGGHFLPEWDVNIALTFFTRALKEHLPLDPPLQALRLKPKPVDEAGVVTEDAGEPSTENPY